MWKPVYVAGLIVFSVLIATAIKLHSGGLGVSPRWEHQVFASELSQVDNLALAADRTVYASLELPDGEGRVVRLRDGARETVLRDMHRADGLALASGHLFVTEEVLQGRVIEHDLKTGHSRVVAVLDKPEGIAISPNGNLIISEDLKNNGRVVRIGPNKAKTVLLSNLKKPEGLTLAADGSVYLAESSRGRILNVKGNTAETVIDGLNHPDQVTVAPDGAIWISEDRKEGRVLRYANGQLETVLTGLVKPQGIAIDDEGWIYIAEQGRGRILRLRRKLGT